MSLLPSKGWVALLILLVGVATSRRALGDEQPEGVAEEQQRADAIFAAAREAFKAEDFVGAAELFRRAHQLRPSANTKFNEAQSWRRASRKPEAADAYAEALALGGLDATLIDAGRRQLDKLEPELARVRIDGPAGTRAAVAHQRDRDVPFSLHLLPGLHRVQVTMADGTRFQQSVRVAAGTELGLALRPPQSEETPSTPSTETGSSVTWILGWTALGLGAAGGIVAGVLGGRFNAVLDDYEATGYVDTELEDEALTLRAATNGVAFSSATLALLGGTLIVVDLATAPNETTVSAAITPTGLSLRGTW